MVPELLGHRLRIPGLWQDRNGTRSLLTNTCSRIANRESRPASHHRVHDRRRTHGLCLLLRLPLRTRLQASRTQPNDAGCPSTLCLHVHHNLPIFLLLYICHLRSESERPRKFPSIAAYCKQPKTGGVEGLGTRLVQQQVMKVLGLSWNQKLKTT